MSFQSLTNLCLIILLLTFLTGCGPRSEEDFREEGEGVTRSLIKELQGIRTREQLNGSLGKIQRHFENLVSIMISAQEYLAAHPEQEKEEPCRPGNDLSDQLRIELNRIYRIDGGRQLIEKSQENALHRLDAFEKRRAK